MNGYSKQVAAMSNQTLIEQWKRLSQSGKYSGPAEDTHYLYRAILDEINNRDIDPAQTIITPTGVVVPCGRDGKPKRDEPYRFITAGRRY
jgi:hypothetical protein